MDFIKEHLGKIVLLLLTVIIVVLAVTYGSALVDKGKGAADSGMAMLDASEALEFSQFNGTKVDGTAVITAARKYATDVNVGIAIKTIKAGATTFYAVNSSGAAPYKAVGSTPGGVVGAAVATPVTASPNQMEQVTHANYVNKDATFKADIYVNTANRVVLISFVEQ